MRFMADRRRPAMGADSATTGRGFMVCVAAYVTLGACAAALSACPFCAGVLPSLAMRRENAAVVALGELVEHRDTKVVYKLHVVRQGRELLGEAKTVSIAAVDDRRPGALALLFVEAPPAEVDEPLAWKTTPVDELSAAYFLRAPDLRKPRTERLPYFIPYLEHADPLLAEDAYREFGHAKYDEVAAVVDQLSQEKIRAWLVDPAVPPERKGFYGLAAGLARDEADRALSVELLQRLILEPASDFRTGYDGYLGGYLMAAGEEGLRLVEERLLRNPAAADGDVRHSITALRFYREFGHDIPPERIQAAVRLLLDRPEFAQTVAVDLARWQDWDAAPKVIALLSQPGYEDKVTRRMLIGFLLSCPRDDALDAVAQLRQTSAAEVAAAEKYLALFGAGR